MPDRIIGKEAVIVADIPGLTSESVKVNVRDSIDVAVLIDEVATPLEDGRYKVTIPEGSVSRSGVWTATFEQVGGGRSVRIPFSVGYRPVSAITLYDLRFQVANQVEAAYDGYVSQSTDDTLTDETLIGGSGEYSGMWVVLDPATVEEASRDRLVAGYNGNTLEVAPPFIVPPTRGTRYVLLDIPPREVDRAIHLAIDEVATVGRIETRVSGIPVTNQIFQVPSSLTHVASVWLDDTELALAQWEMLPGRRVRLSTDITVSETSDVTVVGIRHLTHPVWEDSTLDIEPNVIITLAVDALHAARAKSAGADIEEHLRRQLVAQDRFDRALKRVSGRIPNGSRAVIE